MNFVIFGLTMSSSWGNGHATIWRGLCRALAERKHRITFYEKDVPYYRAHRDFPDLPGGELVLYEKWKDVISHAQSKLSQADIGMVTSYCPDGMAASDLVLSHTAGIRIFYDLDTPVTMEALGKGKAPEYIGRNGLADYDLVLSFTGGKSLEELKNRLGAKRTEPLYGCADPHVHKPVAIPSKDCADLSYLGTYAADRQQALVRFFIEPARRLRNKKFVLGGSMYPEDFPWQPNIVYRSHVAPPDHSAFYCGSGLTLNVTRQVMAETGYCPSGRLFEASACSVPIVSDCWEGLDLFFEPGREILVADTTEDVVQALSLPIEEQKRIARAARDRTLETHTADCRVQALEQMIYSL